MCRQSSCFRWSSGGEWEWSSKAVDCWQRVRVFILWEEGVYWFLSQINVNWYCPIRMQKVREEDQNLYFNAKSSWRWCEFSAHPRVMLYADRTGVELTDIRVRQEILVMWWLILFPFECGQVEFVFLKLNWKAASFWDKTSTPVRVNSYI